MKKIILVLPLMALFAVGRAQAGGPRFTSRVRADGPLMAGTAKVNITPKTDEPIHDSIYARSLVLEDKGVRIAFVAIDLAVFTSDRLEQICREKFGITRLMLSSSHNHSEPQHGG